MRLQARVARVLSQASDRLENRGLKLTRLLLETFLELLVSFPLDGSVLGRQQPADELTGGSEPLRAPSGTLRRRLDLALLPDPLPVVDLRGRDHQGHYAPVAAGIAIGLTWTKGMF